MKYLEFSQKHKDAICQDFIAAIQSCKTLTEAQGILTRLKIPDNPQQPQGIEKPIVIFSSKAYIKILNLVEQCPNEVGWHGTVVKAENKPIFLIKDIILFPQYVSGTSVIPDTEEYAVWTVEQMKDPEHFKKIRYHGHSHVNMGVFSSGTDNGYQEHVLSQLEPDDFYIFTIHNKRNEIAIRIYDTTNNVMFEDKDIEIRWYHENQDITLWANETLRTFVSATYKAPSAPTTETTTPEYWKNAKSYPPANPLKKKKGGKYGSKQITRIF